MSKIVIFDFALVEYFMSTSSRFTGVLVQHNAYTIERLESIVKASMDSLNIAGKCIHLSNLVLYGHR